MKVTVRYEDGMRFEGDNGRGHLTYFDTTERGGGANTAASPFEIFLEAAAACSGMDIVGMLRKMRKTVTALTIDLDVDRSEENPMVVRVARYLYNLVSPDATKADLDRVIKLSLDTYCSVSATIAKAGGVLEWESAVAEQ